MDLGPRYRSLREIGKGGSAIVYLVRDQYLDKELALKLLHRRPGRDDLKQLEREHRLLAELSHPRIARAYDFGRLRGRPYFTSEHVAGSTLAAAPVPEDPAALLELLIAAAEPVAFLHRHELLHLDVKPANFVVREGHASGGPVLIDFGLFRRGFSSSPGPRIQGSLPYMAPEYFRSAPLGPWTDVYALGVTFHRLLGGTYPRWQRGDATWERLSRLEWDPAPPPARAGLRLPDGLPDIVLKCLALDPQLRFRDAGELLAALRGVRGDSAPPASAAHGVRRLIGRDRELEQLDAFLSSLQRGSPDPRIVVVAALPGLGQSHLLRELKLRAQTRGLRAYLEVGYPGHAAAPGSLLRCLGFHAGRSPAGSRWTSFLARLRQARPSRAESQELRRLRHAEELATAAQAVREPLLLLVDGLQHWDEVSIELCIDLVRWLGERRSAPVGLVVGYREEGPAAALLKELSRHALQPGVATLLTLQPLSVEACLELHRSLRDPGDAGSWTGGQGLSLYQASGGSPRKLLALARGGDGTSAPTTPSRGVQRFASAAEAKRAKELLLILSLLRRPATTQELAALGTLRADRAARLLADLETSGLVERSAAAPDAPWLPPALGAPAPEASSLAARRRLHRRIAQRLARSAASPDDPRRVEAARHAWEAGWSRQVIRLGLPAARHLKSTHQNRAALELYSLIYRAAAPRQRDLKVEVGLEMAALHARTGEAVAGIQMLRELLLRSKPLRPARRRRILLQLAVLHARQGDTRRADALFTEGLAAPAGLPAPERLHFLNEHATLKAFLGDYDGARRCCRIGIEHIKGSRSVSLREAALNFHATRATVALRRFDFEAAIADYQRALAEAEAIGSIGNQAVTLNNLGKVYNLCDRYDEALRAFQEAERTSLRIDDGPSLCAIYGNLTILQAKLGNYAEMDAALVKARALAAAGGPRERFFVHHSAGLARLFEGKHAAAREELEAAMRHGGALGDRHVIEYDEVYHAETLLFEQRPAEAERELQRIAGTASTGCLRRMALARWALLEALQARGAMVARQVQAYESTEALPRVPFLEARDALFLAWAAALTGDLEGARARLEPAVAFLSQRGLHAMAGLARLIEVEALLATDGARGDGRSDRAARARELLATVEPRGNALLRILHPYLGARLVLSSPPSRAAELDRCSSLLAEAGTALSACPLPEWRTRVDRLREAMLAPRLAAAQPGRGSMSDRGTTSTRTAGSRATGSARRSGQGELVAASGVMRRLLRDARRLAASDLPVLIRGETGTGKELLARELHRRSERRDDPFIVFDCAAVPRGLLEVELFGARAGAYTDQTQDRPGVLAAARGGTLLLERVEALDLESQAKLLRVLSEKAARPVGAEREEPIDVRFIATTAADLDAEAEHGRFRKDLLHRLRVGALTVPPLRERPEDLEPLVAAFLAEGSGKPPRLEPAAWARLRAHAWPGNVRELRNTVLRLGLESPASIDAAAVERALGDPATSSLFAANVLSAQDLEALKDRLERDYIRYHYRRLEGRTPELCKLLGLNRRQLYNRLKRLGITLRGERRRLGGRP